MWPWKWRKNKQNQKIWVRLRKENMLNINAKLLMEFHILIEKIIINYNRDSILALVVRTKKALKIIKINLWIYHTPLFETWQAWKQDGWSAWHTIIHPVIYPVSFSSPLFLYCRHQYTFFFPIPETDISRIRVLILRHCCQLQVLISQFTFWIFWKVNILT